MSRVAVWRRRPGDPTTALGWIFSADLRLGLPSRSHVLASLFILALGMALWGAVRLLEGHSPSLGPEFYVVMALGSLIVRRRPSRDAHAALPMRAASTDALPVGIEIREGDRVTAKEIGWIGTAEGWLVYEGLRTDFSLKRNSSRAPIVRADGVRLSFGEGRSIRFVPLPRSPKDASWKDPSLLPVFDAWLRAAIPEGDPVLPPEAVHPEAAATRVGRWFVAFVASALLCLFAIPFLGLGAAWLVIVPLFVLAAFLFGVVRLGRELPDLIEPPGTPLSTSRESDLTLPRTFDELEA